MTQNLAWKRSNGAVISHKGIKEIYAYYKKESKSSTRVDQKKFCEVFKDFCMILGEDMAKTGRLFTMPSNMGRVSFKMYENKIRLNDNGDLDTRNISVDWYETKKLWLEDPDMKKAKKRIFHLNEHTDGYKIKFKWERQKVCRVKNQRMYKFILVRDIKKMPNELIKKGHKLQYNDYGSTTSRSY